jgi:quinol monooxygenase YgiN
VEEFEISVAPRRKPNARPPRSLVCTTPQNRIMSNAGSVCVFVTVKIKQDRIDDFLAAMKIDVEGTRKEEGCVKFDLLKGEGDGVYHFYEVYKDSNAAAVHKETAHYKAWADFKASGGVESQEVAKASGVDVQ